MKINKELNPIEGIKQFINKPETIVFNFGKDLYPTGKFVPYGSENFVQGFISYLYQDP